MNYRIWMDALPSESWPLVGGWYGSPGGGSGSINRPIYWRVSNESDALVMSWDSAIRAIRSMRNAGYPCHAVPPITVIENL